jgi:hypothetical protein
MVAARQNGLAAKAPDRGENARVVGGHENLARPTRLTGPFVNVLDKILAGLAEKWLARQPTRGIAGGNDDGRFHGDLRVDKFDAVGQAFQPDCPVGQSF